MKAPSKRKAPRHSLRFGVRSRDLPDFRAITCDLSQSGAQLETIARLTEGAELVLDFEFDREEIGDFSCPARVVWTSEVEGDCDFRAGVLFLPEDDTKKSTLARMATVFQARSESDLEALLEEAKRLDPERAQTFARVRAQSSKKRHASRVLPSLGVLIPLRVEISGYEWHRAEQILVVRFCDGDSEHQLYFPNCRLLTDYGCALVPTVTALYCTPFSETIKKLSKPTPPGGWKQYRFLSADRQPLLELVSGPCQATPTTASF